MDNNEPDLRYRRTNHWADGAALGPVIMFTLPECIHDKAFGLCASASRCAAVAILMLVEAWVLAC